MPVLPSYRNQSIDLHSNSIDYVLYESNTEHDLRLFWQSGAAACIKFETFQGIIGFQKCWVKRRESNSLHIGYSVLFHKKCGCYYDIHYLYHKKCACYFFRYVLYHKYGYFVVYFVLQEICLPYCQLYFVSAEILKSLTSFDIFFFKIFCSYLFMIL